MSKATAATSNKPHPTSPQVLTADPELELNTPKSATVWVGDHVHSRTRREGASREEVCRLPAKAIRRLDGNPIRHLRPHAERGAITAEYAVAIVAACGLGGVLVALLRSPAMQGALKAIINYGLKIAGVEGVHI
ncbi:DUF4244 domain-containing protein [Kribbella sp. NPDC003505]|uniref:DUF4244 domain-containing protein n=1 Tax=Kribbella sp. NPDC003505 TaxID=3154448 RepID=UPI0033A526C7